MFLRCSGCTDLEKCKAQAVPITHPVRWKGLLVGRTLVAFWRCPRWWRMWTICWWLNLSIAFKPLGDPPWLRMLQCYCRLLVVLTEDCDPCLWTRLGETSLKLVRSGNKVVGFGMLVRKECVPRLQSILQSNMTNSCSGKHSRLSATTECLRLSVACGK